MSTIDKLSPTSVRSTFSSLPKYHGDELEEYIYGDLLEIVDKDYACKILQTFKEAQEDTLELYNKTLTQNERFFSGKKGKERKAKFTIGYAEILNIGAKCNQLQPWIDSFYWLEENGLSTAEITTGFIELIRFNPTEEELRLYNKIAFAFLDNFNGRVPEELKEVTKSIVSIFEEGDRLSEEGKRSLLDGELHKAIEFEDKEDRERLKNIGKKLLLYGSITAKVASALALFL